MNINRNRVAGCTFSRGSDIGQVAWGRGRRGCAGGVVVDAAASVAVPCAGADRASGGIDVGEDRGLIAAGVSVSRGIGK